MRQRHWLLVVASAVVAVLVVGPRLCVAVEEILWEETPNGDSSEWSCRVVDGQCSVRYFPKQGEQATGGLLVWLTSADRELFASGDARMNMQVAFLPEGHKSTVVDCRELVATSKALVDLRRQLALPNGGLGQVLAPVASAGRSADGKGDDANYGCAVRGAVLSADFGRYRPFGEFVAVEGAEMVPERSLTLSVWRHWSQRGNFWLHGVPQSRESDLQADLNAMRDVGLLRSPHWLHATSDGIFTGPPPTLAWEATMPSDLRFVRAARMDHYDTTFSYFATEYVSKSLRDAVNPALGGGAASDRQARALALQAAVTVQEARLTFGGISDADAFTADTFLLKSFDELPGATGKHGICYSSPTAPGWAGRHFCVALEDMMSGRRVLRLSGVRDGTLGTPSVPGTSSPAQSNDSRAKQRAPPATPQQIKEAADRNSAVVVGRVFVHARGVVDRSNAGPAKPWNWDELASSEDTLPVVREMRRQKSVGNMLGKSESLFAMFAVKRPPPDYLHVVIGHGDSKAAE